MKSDRSAVVLHHFGLGRTIRFQAAVSDTSGGKHPESSHQLIARPRCLRAAYSNTDKTRMPVYGAWCRVSGACRSTHLGWLKRVPALWEHHLCRVAGNTVRSHNGMCVPVALRLAANCYTPFHFTYLATPCMKSTTTAVVGLTA